MKKSYFPMIVTIGILIFLYLPIVILIVNSFNASRFGGVWKGFSLIWYEKLFQEPAIWWALSNSLIVAICSTLFSTVFGTLAAYGLFRYKTILQSIHFGIIYLPLVVPDILMGISLLLWFVALSVQLGLITIIIAHTTFCLSYITMIVLGRLKNLDYAIIEAAQDLGAGWWTTVIKVLFPLITPAIISGALISFTMSIDDFIITSFVAGPGSTTLPLYVYGLIKHGATPVINALSTLLIFITFAIIWFTQRMTRENS